MLKPRREIELKLTARDDVASACRSIGISGATYDNWRKRFSRMGRSQLSELISLEKERAEPLERHWSEKQRRMLKRIVVEFELTSRSLRKA